MTTKPAAELRVGDVFCRHGRSENSYRVRAVQSVPIHGFYGNLYDTLQVTIDHHLTGRVTHINLSPEEVVWIIPPNEAAVALAPVARSRWGRRRKTI